MPFQEVVRLPSRAIDEDVDAVWQQLRASGVIVLESAATTPAEFERVTEQFATRFRVHQDPERHRYVDDDTTQSVSPGAEALALHAEHTYLPGPPELLFFCCAVPPASGGATTTCDGAAIVDALSPDERQQLGSMRLVWRTSLERRRWQRLWNTTDPARAAALLNEVIGRNGARARHAFDGDTLHVEYHAPALRTGSIGGRPAFANCLLLCASDPNGPQATQEDGRPVPSALLQRVREVADALTMDIAWRRGDVAVIDNTRCMHGRRPFDGGEREILIRMGDVQERFRA